MEASQAVKIAGAGASSGAGMIQGAVKKAIGEEQVRRARAIYQRYRDGKAALDRRVIDNEEWYRMRYYDYKRDDKKEIDPSSGWLFNNIANKHADAMDNYPRANLLPREEGDTAEAEMLSAIIPAIMEQLHFEEIFSGEQFDKIKTGTGIFGVFWDGSADGGIGDVAIRQVDMLSICWEPGIRDIQESAHVFLTTLCDKEVLLQRYPELSGELSVSTYGDVSAGRDYVNDDAVDRQGKVAVIDWYYKKWQGDRQVLHLCKFCGSTVLYATENDPKLAGTGLYEHGKYPFVLDVMYPIKNSPAGFGAVDICRGPQQYIDKLDGAILENAVAGATPRYWAPRGCGVNPEEFADWTGQRVVEYDMGDNQRIFPMETKPLDDVYVSVLNSKINELKEVSGNRDVTQGGTSSGLTAASAIAALVETGSKLSRDANRGNFRAFRQVVELMVELIRQFYTLPHRFRILGQDGEARYERYTNAGLVLREDVDPVTGQVSYRKPLFDVEITAEKSSTYTRLAQNELILQLYQYGFFNPANADASLAALDAMQFDQREQVRRRVSANGTLYQVNQMLMATNQALAAAAGGTYPGAVEAQNSQAQAVMDQAVQAGDAKLAQSGESDYMTGIKQQVAGAVSP